MNRRQKIATVEFFVCRLIGLEVHQTYNLDPPKIEEINGKLSDYSMTRYMRLLYFVCLMDAKGCTEKGEDLTKALLRIFNNFVAYQRGPVEETMYNSRYDDDAFSLFFYNINSRFELNESPTTLEIGIGYDAHKAVDNALTRLREFYVLRDPPKNIVELTDMELTDLSHSLNLEVWNDAFYYNKNDEKN